MKQADNNKPDREDWIALCGAIMRAEYALERLAHRRGVTEKARGKALEAELKKLELVPAYGWLMRQRAYREAVQAYARHVGGGDGDRFELLSAIVYAMEASYAVEAAPGATARARKSAIRYARCLAQLIAAQGASTDSPDDDAALLAQLQRYIAHNEARGATRAPARSASRQLRFGQDMALLLLAGCGAAPPSVIRPLLRLAGPAVRADKLAALLARVRREVEMLEGGKGPRESQAVLHAIEIVPTRRSRRVARTSD